MSQRIYLKKTVWDAALERINWIFDNFENVCVNVSGGKDSTVILNLSLQVAEERNRLPLPVLFIDQEAEWESTIEIIREIMSDPRVEAHWLQVPMLLFNATSATDAWLHCWEPGKEEEWIRPKEPDSIHDNTFGTERFAELFGAYLRHLYGDETACNIGGVRAEESPARSLGLTSYETYKGETWGKFVDKRRKQYVFYPLYDWRYTDIWKAIHDNGWSYSRLYDAQYQYGIPVREMRVSNVHHETAVRSLFYLQEVEHETWERVTRRLQGINTAGILGLSFFKPRELPYMFASWKEYRDHLLDKLVSDPKQKAWYEQTFTSYDTRYEGKTLEELHKTEVSMILVNDYHGTKLETFRAAHMNESRNRGKISGRTSDRRTR